MDPDPKLMSQVRAHLDQADAHFRDTPPVPIPEMDLFILVNMAHIGLIASAVMNPPPGIADAEAEEGRATLRNAFDTLKSTLEAESGKKDGHTALMSMAASCRYMIESRYASFSGLFR